jgi:hypothetical protein
MGEDSSGEVGPLEEWRQFGLASQGLQVSVEAV